jgi:hypothetical protein
LGRLRQEDCGLGFACVHSKNLSQNNDDKNSKPGLGLAAWWRANQTKNRKKKDRMLLKDRKTILKYK